MNTRVARFCLALAAASLLLSGCSVFDEVGSWFSSNGKKSNLRGVRIPVMSLDSELKVDATLAAQPVQLPPPYRNPDWPQPGGYASNALYHLAVPGRLRQAWSQDAGKGSDIDSHLISTPVVGDGLIYALDAEAHVWAFRARDGHPVWNKRLAPKNGTDMPTLWGLARQAQHGGSAPRAWAAASPSTTASFSSPRASACCVCLDAKHRPRHLAERPQDAGALRQCPRGQWRAHLSSPPMTIISIAMAEADGRTLVGRSRASREAQGHAGLHKCGGVRRNRDRALYFGRDFRPARPERPGRLERCAVAHRPCHRPHRSLDDIAGRPVIDRGVVYAISQSEA